jgi:hypothetical protein
MKGAGPDQANPSEWKGENIMSDNHANQYRPRLQGEHQAAVATMGIA